MSVRLRNHSGSQSQNWRINVAEVPLVSRDLAVGIGYTTRATSEGLALANWRSTCARQTQWKPEAQVANQGNSHLSGIEITSRERENRWVKIVIASLKTFRRRRWLGRISLKPVGDDIMVILLVHSIPAKSWRATSLASADISLGSTTWSNSSASSLRSASRASKYANGSSSRCSSTAAASRR